MRNNGWKPSTTRKRLKTDPEGVTDGELRSAWYSVLAEIAGCKSKGKPECNGNLMRLNEYRRELLAAARQRNLELPGGA